LRSLSTPPLPDGVNSATFEVSGDSSVVVNFGTGEIAGGEKSIPAGTKFNLEALANESRYIDIGLGLNFNANGHLNTQSAFNISMPGIKMLGFGVNDEGMPNNMYSLLTKIKDDLSSDSYSFESLSPYIDAFSEQSTQLLYTITNSGAETNFIDFTTVRLEDSKINLTKKIKDVEYIDPAEAIMDFKAQEFSYMAALQMGTKILQPSLLDFMR
ncbi:MAG: flagellar hook-associated protein 3, partial [Oscillospiraceae bacterium]